jgi:hypothetical protein
MAAYAALWIASSQGLLAMTVKDPLRIRLRDARERAAPTENGANEIGTGSTESLD